MWGSGMWECQWLGAGVEPFETLCREGGLARTRAHVCVCVCTCVCRPMACSARTLACCTLYIRYIYILN